MPGVVRLQTQKDSTGGAKQLYRYRAAYQGMEFTIAYGETGDKFRKQISELWEKDRYGKTVELILANTIRASLAVGDFKVRKSYFSRFQDFPAVQAAAESGKTRGRIELAVLTKWGLICAISDGPQTDAACKTGLDFFKSIKIK